MSKWEDTVMSSKRADQIYEERRILLNSACCGCPEDYIEPVLKAQAELSFKAGYEQAREEMNLRSTSLADLCLEHRKGGMKEVVEWLEENSWDGSLQHFGSGNYRVQCIPPDDWLAKLKEWGISGPEIDEAQELAGLRHNASDDTIG